MEHCCSFSLVCCFLFLIPPATIEATPFIDLINSTCTQCAQNSAVFNYDFCVTSLQAVPITHAANLEGIAVVAVELALQNATATVSTIEEMLACAAASDPFAVRCLRDCLELYADAIAMLVESFWEFFSRRFSTANILLSAVMETASTCQEGFTEKEGEMAPLTEENDNLFQLSDIALCITKLVSREQISGEPSHLERIMEKK
ncbi:putative invertase inhibitor [Ipomoea triloba]|uniref:putative invertase inhibitor n=1 Tax=Ipomoea triloba TaxID=35885 RepID=UPI00125D8AEE|nr:putative invertase inhibitor [Ipomoea triloba]